MVGNKDPENMNRGNTDIIKISKLYFYISKI